MLLIQIVRTSHQVTQTPSRLEKIRHLSSCLRHLAADEIEIGVNLLAGRLRQGAIGMGAAAVQATDPERAAVEPSLTLKQIDDAIEAIVRSTGYGSSLDRRRLWATLLTDATPDEQSFLKRLLMGEVRQGALEGVLVEAVAHAADVPAAAVRRALMMGGDLALVTSVAFTEGATGLSRCALHVLHPVQPMLAQPADDVADIFRTFREAAFEYKMDGARVQVHKLGEDVRVFTRTLNDVTVAVPEVVEAVRALPARSIVLDGEVLAFRPDGLPHPFQQTMRRFGRKLDVDRIRQTLPLTPFFFDCLHLDGEDLIDRTSIARVAVMQGTLPPSLVTPRLVTAEVAAAETFLHDALSHGHEGVMAKTLHAAYEAGRRGGAWLKIKRTHTLDLVILAAEWGHGRRQGWLSNLHLGARETANTSFVMLGKTFKGMTDEMLKQQTEILSRLQIARDGHTVYVRPEVVVEVAFNDIQASPQYPGGLALRFARVKRYRPDKTADQADTIDTVRTMYVRQTEGAP